MRNQVRLTEAQLHALIQESVQETLNEWNPLSKLKNGYKNFKNTWFHNPQEGWDNEDEDVNGTNYDDGSSIYTPSEDNEEGVRNTTPSFGQIDVNSAPGQPYSTGSFIRPSDEPTVIGGDEEDVVGNDGEAEDDWSRRYLSDSGNAQPMPVNDTPDESEDTPTPTEEPTPQPTQQPTSQPAYKRGSQYSYNFTDENENLFQNNIKPTYDSLNSVIKNLTQMSQISQTTYDSMTPGFDTLTRANVDKSKNYRIFQEQIASIMPTLQSLKQQMKSVLYNNGIRNTTDYQHYGMEESKMRNIIHNSIQKILKENRH